MSYGWVTERKGPPKTEYGHVTIKSVTNSIKTSIEKVKSPCKL